MSLVNPAVSVLLLLGRALLPGPSQEPFTIRDNVDLVLLDVSVRDSHSYVPGLEKSDFRVFEDGKPRPITQFSGVDAPVSVGLVVDNSGSMRSKRNEVMQAGLAFARRSNPHDEFFVVNFNNSVVAGLPPGTPFTDDFETLRHALYYGSPIGQTALYDAVAFSLKHLERANREQRTLIVVSDGGDNVSKTSLADLLTQIQASRATIYTIGLVDPDNTDLKPGVLRNFAAISGGSYFEPRNSNEVLATFAQISKDIRSRYTIGFAPAGPSLDRPVHTVKVGAARGGKTFHCKTRTSFRIPGSPGNI